MALPRRVSDGSSFDKMSQLLDFLSPKQNTITGCKSSFTDKKRKAHQMVACQTVNFSEKYTPFIFAAQGVRFHNKARCAHC